MVKLIPTAEIPDSLDREGIPLKFRFWFASRGVRFARVKVGQAIEITRLDLSAAALRQEAIGCEEGRIACRILAIAHVLDGLSRRDAARACGMERQTLRDWVHRLYGALDVKW